MRETLPLYSSLLVKIHLSFHVCLDKYLTPKSSPNIETYKDINAITMHHGVQEMTKTKQAKKEGLKKHKQLKREKKQKTKERKKVSLPKKRKKR
jgi:hypothetical protein